MSLALVPPAAAQNDDPQVDPDSPAGTEYQLPIDRAREQASGRSRSTGSTGNAPLFGEGVERPPTDERRPSQSATTRSGSGAAAPAKNPVKQPDGETSKPATLQAQAPAPDGGRSGLAAIGGGAAGVLLIGGLAGLAWRRRSMRG